MDGILGFTRAALDRARTSRDARFDGKFFIAVTTTKIYCRPICPAPNAKTTNVRYYATAAEAAEAGFRPCLRCRPEAAPGTPAWMGASAVVRRALRLIDEGALDEASVEELAGRVGVGPRHLLRLFVQHVGASPIAIAQTRRLHFAKRLLDETDLPITQIAMAAGFGSLRRFNATFRDVYLRAPRDMRKRRSGRDPEPADEVRLRLAFRPPFEWTALLEALAARAVPGVERVDARGYARTLAADGGHALACVRPIDGEDAVALRVRGASPAALFRIASAARRMFDLAADPARIAGAFARAARVGPLVRARPGLRIPGAWDPFECAVFAILCGGGDVAGARALAARMVARLGREVATVADGLTHLYPSAAVLASADLGALGLGAARAAAIRGLARAIATGALDLAAPPEDVSSTLAALPGVGERVAQEVALRALGEPDAFPADDLALRRATSSNGAPLSPHALADRAEAWRPWRGYAAAHLWRAQES